ncbi:LysM peptidoglycan-binding domain-containing protein [Nonomuraea africana]|uniref:LysM peptidoglycan-binding domain-containing protein n=1 Tax=Nonomuraea africana TaxID=46171 RepID=UPI0033F22100
MSSEPIEPPERPESITVGPEESLWQIAEKLFEDGSRWERIYEANRDVLGDPHALRQGMRLRLPMEIYPAHVRSVAGAYDLERNDLATFVKDAMDDLNAIGDFWGGGKNGTTFFKGEGGGTGYEAVSGQIAKGVDALLDAHDEISKRLRKMADRVQVTDWDNLIAILSAFPDD